MQVMARLTWPTLEPDQQWVTAALERDLLECSQTPEELRAEARMLRGWAAQVAANGGGGQAFLMMAANYEAVAAAR